MKKDHMQKVKQKVPKDKSHLDPGQAKLLEIALIFWRYDSQYLIVKFYPQFHLKELFNFTPLFEPYFISPQRDIYPHSNCILHPNSILS